MELLNYCSWILVAMMIFLAILIICCLVRAIIGPSISDRVVAVNMMGTMVIVIIAILAIYMNEGYLADICLIYAMISFLAVVVLTKLYTGVYLEKKDDGKMLFRQEEKDKEGEV